MFRWFALAVFLSSVAISAWLRRRARLDSGAISRSEEPPLLIAGRLLVALPLFGGVVAYFINPPWMAFASLALPSALRWAGVALGALTVPFVYWTLSTLGCNVSETVFTKQRHQLVMRGPYRWVRHPLYSSGICLFLSVGMMAANGFILLWTAVALLAVRLLVIPREEKQLVLKFGEEYRRYREVTGALWPSSGSGGRRGE